MRPPIFDDRSRALREPQSHGESTFQFFNRVGGDFWQHPRNLVQSWADHLPNEEDYLDARNRIRSNDDGQFRSVFLELYLHEWLLRAGYTVSVHPQIPGTSRRPDFLAKSGETAFYLEATAPDAGASGKARAARLAPILDALDAVGDERFFLELCDVRYGVSSARASALKAQVSTWLRALDPDAPENSPASVPFTIAQDDWVLTLRALPISRANSGTPVRRSIGVYAHMPVSITDDAAMIFKALRSKSSAYGDLQAPYVIAVGSNLFDSDRSDITDALYGHAALSVPRTGPAEARSIRLRDGFFGAAPSWTRRRVSAVLMVNQLQPARVLQADVSLWRHPAASRPLPNGTDLPGDVISLRGESLHTAHAARSIAERFGIGSDWPPGDPWPGA